MPLYEYFCSTCGKTFELLRKYEDMDKHVSCSEVGCPRNEDCSKQRIISLSSFQLKGSGWARDNYTKNPKGSK